MDDVQAERNAPSVELHDDVVVVRVARAAPADQLERADAGPRADRRRATGRWESR